MKWSKLTIKQTFILISFIGIIFIVIFGFYTLRGMNKLNAHADRIIQYEVNKIEIIDTLVYNVLSLNVDEIELVIENQTHDQEAIQKYELSIEKIIEDNQKLLLEYGSYVLTPEEEEIYNNLLLNFKECETLHDQLFFSMEQSHLTDALSSWENLDNLKKEMLEGLNDLRFTNTGKLRSIRIEINNMASQEFQKLLILLLVGIGVMMTSHYIFTHSISRRLKQTITYALNISDDKNTQNNKPPYSKDELDIIIKSLEKMKINMEKLRLEIHYQDVNRSSINQELKEKVNLLNQHIEETKVMIDKSINEKINDVKDTINEVKK